MAFQSTAARLWKHLAPADRLAAASAFFAEPPPELAPSALGVIASARHMRPQAARALSPDAQAHILATVLDPGESLAQGLLVALHLAQRRPLLAAFLDALGLPHEEGVLKDEADALPPVAEPRARQAVAALSGFPWPQVEVYLNTLLLQDPERWAALAQADQWSTG
jgi:hypothetical protein